MSVSVRISYLSLFSFSMSSSHLFCVFLCLRNKMFWVFELLVRLNWTAEAVISNTGLVYLTFPFSCTCLRSRCISRMAFLSLACNKLPSSSSSSSLLSYFNSCLFLRQYDDCIHCLEGLGAQLTRWFWRNASAQGRAGGVPSRLRSRKPNNLEENE